MPFRKREFHYSLRSKIQTGTQERRWFKTASYTRHDPSDIILDKIQQKHKAYNIF